MITCSPADPHDPEVRAIFDAHYQLMCSLTPPEDVFALTGEEVDDPHVSFVCARVDGTVLGIGAIKELGDGHAELKSMHTLAAARGRGVGRALLDHLVDVARARGITRLSLETGAMESYAPARALYERAGFEVCAVFGDYPDSPNSTFMTLAL